MGLYSTVRFAKSKGLTRFAAGRADESRVPELFVQFHGIVPGITAMPLVQDRQVAPGAHLHHLA